MDELGGVTADDEVGVAVGVTDWRNFLNKSFGFVEVGVAPLFSLVARAAKPFT